MRIKLTEQQVTGLVNNLVGDIDLEKEAPETVKLVKSFLPKPLTKAYDIAKVAVDNLKGKKDKTKTQPASTVQNTNVSPNNEMLHPLGRNVKITSYYGSRNAPTDPSSGRQGSTNHKGIDLSTPQGSPIYSPLDGVVSIVEDSFPNACGYHLEVDHNSLITKYCHLSAFKVRVGQEVKRGQIIALSGGKPGTAGAGTTTGPHLHYEILHKDRTPYDPIKDIDANLTA